MQVDCIMCTGGGAGIKCAGRLHYVYWGEGAGIKCAGIVHPH